MPNHITNKLVFNTTVEKMEEIFNTFNTHVEAEEGYSYDGELRFKEKNKKYSYGFLNLKTGIFSRRNYDGVLGVPDGFVVDISPAFDHFPDFNKVIPQPENIFNGDLGEKERNMCIKEGRPNWYDWNTEFWGTKWNSYSCEKVSWNTFIFQTAWSSVPMIVVEMSKKLPDVEIVYTFADEDSGYNTGIIKYKNGEILESEFPKGGSSRGYELYLSLNPDCNYVRCIDGVYQYVEEE